MRVRRGDPPIRPPHDWPVWNRPCVRISWRTGKPCKGKTIRGTDLCHQHGGGGINRVQGWKRYLLWVLLPESVRQTGIATPVTDEEVSVACQALAEAILTGDSRMTERQRMLAVEYLFASHTLDAHPDPASLLEHLSREDAVKAISILRRHNLLH